MCRLQENTAGIVKMRREGTKIDLGIVKYHFELAAGKENFA